jgi:restriction system protein
MSIQVEVEWTTPSGKQRNAPMYAVTVRNQYLDATRTFRGTDKSGLERRAGDQLRKWQQQEGRQRAVEAKQDALERAEEEAAELDVEVREKLSAISGLLEATLSVDDRIDWEQLRDRRPPEPFLFSEPTPELPDVTPKVPEVPYASYPKKPWYASFLPWVAENWRQRSSAVEHANQRLHVEYQGRLELEIARCEQLKTDHTRNIASWEARRDEARVHHARECEKFAARQAAHNAKVDQFKTAFEGGHPGAVAEYFRGVFERSDYPECFTVSHSLEFEQTSSHLSVAVDVPSLTRFPEVSGYTFARAKGEAKPVALKKRERAELYERAVAEVVIRTLHELFESDYPGILKGADVSAFDCFVDPATGRQKRTCLMSVSLTRQSFRELDLRRLNAVACVNKFRQVDVSSE